MAVVYGTYLETDSGPVMFVPCERCGSIIGRLTQDEVVALTTGRYGPVLCFDCEDNSCSDCHKELTEREIGEYWKDCQGNKLCWYCFQRGVAK